MTIRVLLPLKMPCSGWENGVAYVQSLTHSFIHSPTCLLCLGHLLVVELKKIKFKISGTTRKQTVALQCPDS